MVYRRMGSAERQPRWRLPPVMKKALYVAVGNPGQYARLVPSPSLRERGG